MELPATSGIFVPDYVRPFDLIVRFLKRGSPQSDNAMDCSSERREILVELLQHQPETFSGELEFYNLRQQR